MQKTVFFSEFWGKHRFSGQEKEEKRGKVANFSQKSGERALVGSKPTIPCKYQWISQKNLDTFGILEKKRYILAWKRKKNEEK